MRFAICIGLLLVSASSASAQSSRYSIGGNGGASGAGAPMPPNPTADIAPITPLDTADLGGLDLPAFSGDARPAFGDLVTPGQQPAPSRPAATAAPTASSQPTTSATNPAAPRNAAPAANPYVPPSVTATTPPASTSAAASTPTGELSLAKRSMIKIMQVPANSQLPGGALRLVDVVANTSSRREQTQRVAIYWDLCSIVADYYLSLRELDELNRLLARSGAGNRALSEAVADMRVRVDTSRRAALATQMRLASAMGLNTLPLPADMPHVGGYETHYDRIFAGRTGGEAAELNKVIPLRHAEVQAAATAISRAEDWLETKAATQNAEEIVRAMELLALRRRAFVQIAKDYNLRIAHYTELSTPGVQPTTQLVAMLIKTSSNASTPSQPAATARNPYGPQSSIDSPPATFAGDWNPPSLADREAVRDPRVQPASVNPLREERSVLQQPATPSDELPLLE